MSRHTFKTTYDNGLFNRPVEVAAGWDRPLQGFFLTVQYTDGEQEYAFNNLATKLPHPPEFGTYIALLKDMGVDCPDKMLADIIEDGRINMGNKPRTW